MVKAKTVKESVFDFNWFWSPSSKEILRIMIRYWLYSFTWQTQGKKENRDHRQRKQIINKETDTTAIMLYLLKKRDRTWEKKIQKYKLK